MQPILIFKNQSAIDNANNIQNEALEFWQNIVDQFNNLELGEEKKLSGNDLVLFVQNPKAFVVDKVTQGESLVIGSMPISKEKAFEILELPPQLYQIISQVEKIKKGEHSSGFLVRNLVANFTINAGTVEFTDKYTRDIEKTHSIFASTPKQKQAWELMQEIATKLNDLRTITRGAGYSLNTEDMSLFFGLDESKDSQRVNKANPEVIKRLN